MQHHFISNYNIVCTVRAAFVNIYNIMNDMYNMNFVVHIQITDANECLEISW